MVVEDYLYAVQGLVECGLRVEGRGIVRIVSLILGRWERLGGGLWREVGGQQVVDA